MSLTGNKGEWSEIYVVLKLLAEGKLFSADENVSKIENVFYPIIKIIRDESAISTKLEYIVNSDIILYDATNNVELLRVPISEFLDVSTRFISDLKKKSGRSFKMDEYLDFLSKIKIFTLKSKSEEKADITLVVNDNMTNSDLQLSFSIKSLVGKKPTLLNPGPGTNFEYIVQNQQIEDEIDITEFNKETYTKISGKGNSKIGLRIKRLEEMGYTFTFDKIQSQNFELNLQVTNPHLPEIVANMLLYKYKYGTSKISDLVKLLYEYNPLKYNLDLGHPFYINAIRRLLYDYALGMTPETVWKGLYASTGGIIIVKNTGEALCYRVHDINKFQDYLISNTMLDQPSTGEDPKNPGNPRKVVEGEPKSKNYYYGWLYTEDNLLKLKLNLQVRFQEQKIKKIKQKPS